MITSTIVAALNSLGFVDGWAANEADGIILWTREEPQPTEEELVAAGWIKPAPVEEAQTSTDAG
jgi:hypothetical protein